jgi:SHS2 domain-containing protein
MENRNKYRLTRRQSELAVRVTGGSQADLFANSALALFDVMADVEKIEIKERIILEVEGTDRDDLMVNWMRELLYLYQSSGYLLKEFNIREVRDTIVKAEVCGEKSIPTATRSSRKSARWRFTKAAWKRPVINGPPR